MSDATPDPSQAELDANSVPAFLRHAPRFGRIIGTGAVAGFILGFLIALGLPGRGASYRIAAAVLIGLGIAMVGALAAGAIATRSDGTDPRPGAPSGPVKDKLDAEFLERINADAAEPSGAASAKKPATTAKKPATSSKKPATTAKKPATSSKKPAASAAPRNAARDKD